MAPDKPGSVYAAIYLSSLPVEVSLLAFRAGNPQTSTYLGLLRKGVTEPDSSRCQLVGSYPTVSPLPARIDHSVLPPTFNGLSGQAVCSLWPYPQGYPCLPFGSFLPCGARTFLPYGRLLQEPLAQILYYLYQILQYKL